MKNNKWLVLLVENEPYLQQTLVQALNAAFRGSVETMVSSTPKEALAMADEHEFDLVVTEYTLPAMGGSDLIARIRISHPDLPAVLLSEVNPDLLSTKTLSLADGFLTKPFELTKFFKVINSVLQHGSGQMNGAGGNGVIETEPQEITKASQNGSNGSSSQLSSSNGTSQADEEGQSDAVQILIVEDDTGLMYIYQKALGKAGYEVFKARNIAEAKPLIENGTYDIMICDIQLGRERGTDLIEQYGEELKAKGTQIIMVSSYGEYRHITDDLGVDFFLEKPISIASLITMVDRLSKINEPAVVASN